MRQARRVLVASGVAATLLFCLVGFAHTRSGRPLLRLLGRVYRPSGGSCPLGYDQKASTEQREEGRKQFAATHAGSVDAVARPALGFVLDRTRREDVLAWAQAHHVECSQPATGYDLECSHVPAGALPDLSTPVAASALWLNFGSNGTLISLTGVIEDPNAAPIGQAFQDLNGKMRRLAGDPFEVHGTGAAQELSAGLLQQASAEYRFRNYYALARATNMGKGFVLTEVYRSLAD